MGQAVVINSSTSPADTYLPVLTSPPKMIFQVAVAVLLVVVGALAHPDGYEPAYPSEPLPYHFNYAVHDDYKGTHFGQNEKSDGDAVYGSYTVALPDGRKQTVDYTADHYKGFVAKVSYDGQAKHPKHYGPAVTFKQNGGGYH